MSFARFDVLRSRILRCAQDEGACWKVHGMTNKECIGLDDVDLARTMRHHRCRRFARQRWLSR